MLAILAAILAGVGYILVGSGDHTNTWLSPSALTLACIGLLALYLVLGNWPRQR